MEINPLGLIAATTVFLSIGIGHVSVRKVESISVHLWKPMLASIVVGLVFEFAALSTSDRSVSMILGILGITLLWDALELRRQAHRVRKGHAPDNQNNPRHSAMLAETETAATTIDLLNRDPVGWAVDPEETVRLVEKRRFSSVP